jgi:eukaryotic-like serine/threonine-protein kinase
MANAQESLYEGALIQGQFRLTRQIGTGGMSAVWAAEHLRLNGLVAIKFLGREYRRDEEAKLRFVHEAQSASRIRSPHVVQVLDQGTTDDGIPYLVMELLEGEDLAQRLDRIGACSLPETAVIVEQIGRALSKAHREGLVHRDIKPHNIYLVADGSDKVFVKLLDFGIAKDVTYESKQVTLAGSVLGSAHYMSPEQLSDPQSVGPETDIWALGVVVYEMLSGQVPFDGRSLPDILLCAREAKFPPLAQLRPDLPVELDDWLRKAMHPDPQLRFESVDQTWRAFSLLVWGQVDDTPTSPAPPLPTPLSTGSVSRSAVATLVTMPTVTWRPLPTGSSRVRLPNQLPRWAPVAVALCAVTAFVLFVVLNLRPERAHGARSPMTTVVVPAPRVEPIADTTAQARANELRPKEPLPDEPPPGRGDVSAPPVELSTRPARHRKTNDAAESARSDERARVNAAGRHKEKPETVQPEAIQPAAKYRGF